MIRNNKTLDSRMRKEEPHFTIVHINNSVCAALQCCSLTKHLLPIMYGAATADTARAHCESGATAAEI